MEQLRRLQAMVMNSSNKPAQTGTCVLVQLFFIQQVTWTSNQKQQQAGLNVENLKMFTTSKTQSLHMILILTSGLSFFFVTLFVPLIWFSRCSCCPSLWSCFPAWSLSPILRSAKETSVQSEVSNLHRDRQPGNPSPLCHIRKHCQDCRLSQCWKDFTHRASGLSLKFQFLLRTKNTNTIRKYCMYYNVRYIRFKYWNDYKPECSFLSELCLKFAMDWGILFY